MDDLTLAPQKNVCAVIVSYNSPKELTFCINSALNQVDKIIVIDNGSDFVRSLVFSGGLSSDKLVFILNEKNRGLGCALNQGLQHSRDNGYFWTLLLDQDSSLSENMMAEMMRSYSRLDDESKREIAAVVCTVVDRNFCESVPAVLMGNYFNKKIINPVDDTLVHFHITSGSLIKNEIIGTVGLMKEFLFIDYVDFDYCFRILGKKYKILLSKNAVLYHSLAEWKKKFFFHIREHDAARVYYQTRNRLFVLFKYGKNYRSFFYLESFKFAAKLFKIIFFEANKSKKLIMYCNGIRDFLKNYKQFDTLK